MTAPRDRTATHTILLVDDEQEILDGLRRSLRREPYRLLATTSPRAAVELLATEDIDLLLSDIDMPEMTGLELVAHARAAHPDVIRVLLTGDASTESAIRAINDGEVHRYLTKPWDAAELRATLAGALARLDELRRVAAVDRTHELRERLLADLERAHPGIRAATVVDGAYVLSGARLAAIAASLDDPTLRAYFAPTSPLPGDVGPYTRRLRR